MSKDNFIPPLITFNCIVGISLAVRSVVLSYGADNFTATSLFVLTTVITFSLFLAGQSLIQDLFSLTYSKGKAKGVEKISEKQTVSNFSVTSSFDYQHHRQEALLLKAKEEQEKIDAVIAYSQKTLAPYMRESELTQLTSELNAFLTTSWTPKESKSVELSNQLKSIDLMHFGWNIAQPFKISRKETATFLKYTFTKSLEEVEISTIQRKMTNNESKSLIPLNENITTTTLHPSSADYS